ncbi:helix-turn-helix transcriptional regulator [Pseudonocardia sp. ICBG1142]|nr:helix-turn-helix transcriptional regulator [Pseudonocardia sp. ICBG1142]
MHRLRRSGAASAAGDLPLALECLLDAGRHLDHLGWRNPAVFPWRGRAALLAARLGEVGTARDLAETELSLATSWGAPAALGRALRVRAELAEGPERLRLLRSASAVLADSEDGAEIDRVTVALEHCPDAVPRPGAAGGGSVPPRPVPRPVLAPRPAAGAPAASAEAPLGAAVAARAGSSRSTGTGAGRLTAGEQEAVALVRAGASNQQIAQQLRVSRRAVEKRLTSAYRKLGIGGRGDLGPG